ncbi:Hypothetical predicted protein [Marmota monax]|uniref:Uncharacterized protein n=1 Tax=Marmota monax TaxID=9995 RepID=A0A5E4A638_MARMO|nr:Hypothetical predicted protein [Marmota monax]
MSRSGWWGEVPLGVHLYPHKADQKLEIIKQMIQGEQMTQEEWQVSQNECLVLKLLHHTKVTGYYENFLEDKALTIAIGYAPSGTLAQSI